MSNISDRIILSVYVVLYIIRHPNPIFFKYSGYTSPTYHKAKNILLQHSNDSKHNWFTSHPLMIFYFFCSNNFCHINICSVSKGAIMQSQATNRACPFVLCSRKNCAPTALSAIARRFHICEMTIF